MMEHDKFARSLCDNQAGSCFHGRVRRVDMLVNDRNSIGITIEIKSHCAKGGTATPIVFQ